MQVQLNFNVDLGTAAGRAEFQRMFEHLFVPSLAPSERVPGTFPNTGSSIPDDPVRAEAARAGRQQAAAMARAAKAAKAGAANAAAGMSGPVEAVLGPVDDLAGPAETNGELADDLGLADPSMSPGEALEAGLVLVRQMYSASKFKEVKALQNKWGVAKFYDVPVEKGHEFYAEALKLSHAVMGQGA